MTFVQIFKFTLIGFSAPLFAADLIPPKEKERNEIIEFTFAGDPVSASQVHLHMMNRFQWVLEFVRDPAYGTAQSFEYTRKLGIRVVTKPPPENDNERNRLWGEHSAIALMYGLALQGQCRANIYYGEFRRYLELESIDVAVPVNGKTIEELNDDFSVAILLALGSEALDAKRPKVVAARYFAEARSAAIRLDWIKTPARERILEMIDKRLKEIHESAGGE